MGEHSRPNTTSPGIDGVLERARLIDPRPAVRVEEPRRLSPECMVDAHDLCPGEVYEWPQNAAYATPPTKTWVCGCPTPECDCTEHKAGRS